MSSSPSKGLEKAWMILACFPGSNGVGFIIAGATARNRKWLVWGAVMLVPVVLLSSIQESYATERELEASLPYNVLMTAIVGSWILGIFLAFRIRGAWRLAVASRRRGRAPVHYAPTTAAPFQMPQPLAGPTPPPPPAPPMQPPVAHRRPPVPPAAPTPPAHEPVDVNAATAADLVRAGLAEHLAQRVVAVRDAGGAYTSQPDLVERAQLMPHELAVARGRVVVHPPRRPPPGGRVVDV